MEIDKDQLQKLKGFIKNHPEEAKQILKHDPEFIKFVSELMHENDVPIVNFGQNGEAGRTTEKRKTLTKPGVPNDLYVNSDKGFSNYLLLAILAFSIQLFVTIICILFYK